VSIQAMTRVMELSESAGTARLVLLVMANRAGGDEDLAFPSVDRIAFECRMSRRSVQENLRKLVASGELVDEGTHPRFHTRVYRVLPLSGGVQNLHGAESRPTSAPELNKRGSSSALGFSSSGGTPLRERKRDFVFDALVEVCGWKLEQTTKRERGGVAKASHEIRGAWDTGDLDYLTTLDEVSRRADHYRRRYPNAALTPNALAMHWGECANPALSTSPVEEWIRPSPLDPGEEAAASEAAAAAFAEWRAGRAGLRETAK
jgi:hypothetical protein